MSKNRKLCLVILSLCLLLVAILALTACDKTYYTLTFYTNGGADVKPMQFQKGSSVNAPIPTKAYFTFDGWYADEEFVTPFEQFDSMPDHDVTVYAKWIAGESSKITFETNGGSAVAALTGVVGQSVTPPQSPTKYGYSFGGWYSDENLTSMYVFGTYPSDNITLYAKWSKDANFNYVTYVLNGVATEVPTPVATQAVAPALGDDVVCVWYTDESFTTAYNFSATVNADTTLYGLMYSKGLAFDGATIVGYEGSGDQIFIPEKYDGQLITTIGAGAFANMSIKYVTLPKTVTQIGEAAFYKCEYLLDINVTASVTTIGKFAFADCSRLASTVDLSGVNIIYSNTFANCAAISQVVFGEQLTEIGENAFINCASLTQANLSDSVNSIYSYAFANSGITSLTIPTSLTQWGTGVVKGCNIKSVTGGNSSFTLDTDNGTLMNGSTLLLYFETETNKQDSLYVLPPRITNVAPFAFYGNRNIEELDVSASISQPLSQYSLAGMQALSTLTVKDFDANHPFLAYWFGANEALDNTAIGLLIPSSLTAITFTNYQASEVADYAFYGANGLQSVDGIDNVSKIGKFAYAYTAFNSYRIGSSVSSFDNTAFRGVGTLQAISVEDNNATYSVFDDALYNKNGEKLIYVPEGKTDIVFTNSVREIVAGAMANSKVGQMTVPDSVETIGYGAFQNMNRLSSLTVPFIGGSADSNRYMLYVFGATITTEGNGSPKLKTGNCPASLKSITVTSALTAVPANAFAFCSNVATINLKGEYSSIESGAFAQTALTEVVISDEVTTVGNYAYYNCDSIVSVVVGKGATSIGDLAFASCVSLQSIVFEEGNGDLSIGRGAFLAENETSNGVTTVYSNVQELVLSNNIVSIGQSAFSYVGVNGTLSYQDANGNVVEGEAEYAYFEIIFDVEHSRLQTIDKSAFGVSGIYKLVLPASIQSIGTIAFGGCDVLSQVTIGSADHMATQLTFIGGGAFSESPTLRSFTLYKSVSSESEVPTLGDGTDLFNTPYGVFTLTSTQIYVPADSVDYYKAAWNTTLNSLADYIVAIR